MNKVKGFNYDDVEHKDIIEHLNKQENTSKYIRELVKKDMSKEDNEEKKIEEIIKRLLANKNIIVEEKFDVNVDSINDILNL